ncbi:MAG: translation initiation factor IF-1A [Candidatus Korarchaeota archaeon]|nr:translation initiation factor IF-1A [Candidatus Korarchaeota archaeon]NIU84436.1 translation initiation factor IF-1A [Candidatus Thorarchaeota archaeon]NIW12919.1 translation initiation factor IF-1A [Candidatus Thorarchaeota archaeon]NIW51883.1 translation initiation factor IF-1A [Candidatus Korarchaeota archaeon]
MPEDEEKKVRIRLPNKENGEMLGLVLRRLGGLWLEVKCSDDKIRKARIPGSRRRIRVYGGDVVIVKPWYGLQPETRADVIWKYRKHRVRHLLDTQYEQAIRELIPEDMHSKYLS